MKKLVVLTVVLLAFASLAFAQTQDTAYQLNYYANRNNTAGADATVRIINDGLEGSPISAGHGTICADIYVFDAIQEMTECCHCQITGNGLLQLSVLGNLTANPLTGFPAANSGVIKLLGDTRANCNETSPSPTAGLLAWATHVQQPIAGTFVTTETEFLPANLSASELAFLGTACTFVQFEGSGKGVCTCPSEGPAS